MNNDVVIIQLDRPRKLKFNHTALKTLCELTGKTVNELDEQGVDLSDFDYKEKFVYCGLLQDAKENNETLTIDQIPELLDEAPNQGHIMEQLIRAWVATFGIPVEGNMGESAEEQPIKKTGTGKKA